MDLWPPSYSTGRDLVVLLRQADPHHCGPVPWSSDVWTWLGIHRDSKLLVSWMLGSREASIAKAFAMDLGFRLVERPTLTTDGYQAYPEAIDNAFGMDVEYESLKRYADEVDRRYSPRRVMSATQRLVMGAPHPSDVTISRIERQNLTLRMMQRRFARLTNAFSKKLENHARAVALHAVYYNWCWVHGTLRATPAMAAGLDHKPRDAEWIVGLI